MHTQISHILMLRISLFIQRENPLVSRVYDQINEFLTRLACKFLAVAPVKAEGSKVANIDYVNAENHIPGILASQGW